MKKESVSIENSPKLKASLNDTKNAANKLIDLAKADTQAPLNVLTASGVEERIKDYIENISIH